MSAATIPAAPVPPPCPPAAVAYAASLADDPARRRALARVRRLMPTPDCRLVRLYEAGRLLLALRPARTYRTRWADALSARLACDRSFVYKLTSFADAYTAEQVAGLEAADLSWSHVDLVLKFTDTGFALEQLQRAADGGWSVRDLQVRLRRLNPVPEPRRYRAPAAPQSHGLEVDIREALKPAEEVIRLYEAVWDVPPEALAGRSLTGMSDGTRELAAYAAARFRQLQADAAATAARLETIAGAE